MVNIGKRIIINKVESEKIENNQYHSIKSSIFNEVSIYVAEIFVNLFLVSLLTAIFSNVIFVSSLQNYDILVIIISLFSSLIVFYVFEFLSNIISKSIFFKTSKYKILAIPFIFFMILSFPFRKLFELGILHEKILKRYSLTYSEISDVIENSKVEPEDEQEKKLIKGVINFSDLEVKEIMKSRVDLVVFDMNQEFSSILSVIIESGYSRFPVYENSLDNIKGVLHLKDILPFMRENNNFDWSKHIRPAFFVPENLKINSLLKEFQSKKYHLAVIVDEYGGTSGIVTLEDILEEIVGEINDEFDTEKDGIEYDKINEFEYRFEGKTSLNDFCKIIDYSFDKLEDIKGDAETLAGLLIEIEGKFPIKGQKIVFDNIEFVIDQMDNRRIQKIKVSKLNM